MSYSIGSEGQPTGTWQVQYKGIWWEGKTVHKKALTKILAETNGPNHGNVSSFIIRYRKSNFVGVE
jgi:hypothetical protein